MSPALSSFMASVTYITSLDLRIPGDTKNLSGDLTAILNQDKIKMYMA
jgi:hypothetical protein